MNHPHCILSMVFPVWAGLGWEEGVPCSGPGQRGAGWGGHALSWSWSWSEGWGCPVLVLDRETGWGYPILVLIGGVPCPGPGQEVGVPCPGPGWGWEVPCPSLVGRVGVPCPVHGRGQGRLPFPSPGKNLGPEISVQGTPLPPWTDKQTENITSRRT